MAGAKGGDGGSGAGEGGALGGRSAGEKGSLGPGAKGGEGGSSRAGEGGALGGRSAGEKGSLGPSKNSAESAAAFRYGGGVKGDAGAAARGGEPSAPAPAERADAGDGAAATKTPEGLAARTEAEWAAMSDRAAIKFQDAPGSAKELLQRFEGVKDAPIPPMKPETGADTETKSEGDAGTEAKSKVEKLNEAYVELRTEVERLMIWSRHVLSAEQRAELGDRIVKRWNEIMRRDNPDWVDKVDRRDETTLSIDKTERPDGPSKTDKTSNTNLHDPETTLCFRGTLYGEQLSAKMQASVSGGSGDDAGHLAADQDGSDPLGVEAGRINKYGFDPTTGEPVEVANLARQNLSMNRGSSWGQVENAIVKEVDNGATGYVKEVVSKTRSDIFDGAREYYRTCEVKGPDGKHMEVEITQKVPGTSKKDTVLVTLSKDLIFMNPSHENMRDAALKSEAEPTDSNEKADGHEKKKDNVIYVRFGQKGGGRKGD